MPRLLETVFETVSGRSDTKCNRNGLTVVPCNPTGCTALSLALDFLHVHFCHA